MPYIARFSKIFLKAKELGTKRAIEFISEIKMCYGDSVVELRKATETVTIEQIEAEVKTLKKQRKIRKHT